MAGKQHVTSFIRSTFRSVWSLELLCFLRKNRETAWSQAEMVAALRGSELIIAQSLTILTAAGLIVVHETGTAQYQPASDGLDELVVAAEALYARSPDKVRRLIVSGATDGVTAFADAFRVRRD